MKRIRDHGVLNPDQDSHTIPSLPKAPESKQEVKLLEMPEVIDDCREQCFPEPAGQLHIIIQSGCDSMLSIFTHPIPTKYHHGGKEWLQCLSPTIELWKVIAYGRGRVIFLKEVVSLSCSIGRPQIQQNLVVQTDLDEIKQRK